MAQFAHMAFLSLEHMAQWGEVLTGVASLVIAGGVALAYRDYRRQAKESRVALLTGMSRYVNEVAILLVEHPEMVPFFRNGEQPDDDDRRRAEAIAMALANALDHVLFRLGSIKGSKQERAAWIAYCKDLKQNSPVMVELLEGHKEWYGEPLRKQFGVE